MGQFVGDQRGQRAVAGQHGGCEERQSWIFHTTEGKARRQHQHVVATPTVGSVHRLGGDDHPLGIGKLPGRGLHDLGLGIDAGARTQLAELQLADAQRHQVGRDRLRHVEAVGTVLADGGRVLGAHDRHQPRWDTHGGVVGHANRRGVLQWDPTAGEDRLGLGQQERMTPTGGLLRRQPLQCGGLRPGGVVDVNDLGGGIDGDRQTATDPLGGRSQLENGGTLVVQGDRGDLEIPGIESQLVGTGAIVDGQRCTALDHRTREVDRDVQTEMIDGDLLRTRAGVRVVGRRLRGLLRGPAGRGQQQRRRQHGTDGWTHRVSPGAKGAILA